jgi:hypothetical protein
MLFVSEIAHVASLRLQKSGQLIGIDTRRGDQPVFALVIAPDMPSVVVKEQVMVLAEQDSVGDVALIYPYGFVLSCCYLCPHFP